MAMIGAYQSSVTKTASQATERLKIPYVCSDSSSPTLTERGLKYFFRVSPHDAIFARDQFNFLKDLEKAKKQKVQTIAVLYENTEFGSNVGKQVLKLAPEFGYKVVADISYAANATDVTSEVGRLIKANPDVLMHASYITDAILFTKTFKEMGFNPKGIMTFAGYIEPGYLPAVKADGNFIVVRSTFALDLAKNKPLVAKVNALFKKKYGIDMSENAARSFTAPFVLADAINRAKTTEAEAVVKALLATNIPGDQVIYPWKGIQFDPREPPEHPRARNPRADPEPELRDRVAVRVRRRGRDLAVPRLENAEVAVYRGGGPRTAPLPLQHSERGHQCPNNCWRNS